MSISIATMGKFNGPNIKAGGVIYTQQQEIKKRRLKINIKSIYCELPQKNKNKKMIINCQKMDI